MTMSGLIYVCSAGETWDSAAYAIYSGDESRAAELMCANPGILLTGKSVFTGGEELKIPVVEAAEAGAWETAPWRR